MPAAAHTEKSGSFTNTQRMLQWHHKAVEPAGRRAQRPVVHLPPGPADPGEAGRRSRGTAPQMDRPVLDLTWDYPTEGAIAEPDAEAVLRRDQRLRTPTASRCPSTRARRTTAPPPAAAGSTAACYADGVNQAARRKPGSEQRLGGRRSGAGPGRRTGASSTTGPPPTPTAGRGASARPWSGGTPSKRQVDRARRPRLRAGQGARLPAAGGRHGPGRRCPGATRSSCRPTARRGCTPRPGWSTGRCRRTTSRRSRRSATCSTASSATRSAR